MLICKLLGPVTACGRFSSPAVIEGLFVWRVAMWLGSVYEPLEMSEASCS